MVRRGQADPRHRRRKPVRWLHRAGLLAAGSTLVAVAAVAGHAVRAERAWSGQEPA
jgi:hypothetical protein